MVFFHTGVFAKWVFLGTVTGPQGPRSEYYDDTPIGKGNFPKLWIMRNYEKGFKDEQGDVYFSEKNLYEFSCNDNQIRLVSITQYSDNFGKGNVTYTTSSNFKGTWKDITPETTVSVWKTTVCK